MGRLVGYDPARIAELVRRTRESVEDLRTVSGDDPVASDALAAVAAVRFALETQWLPVLARVVADRSMAGWSAGPPPPATSAGAGGCDGSGAIETAATVAAIDAAADRLRDGDEGALEELRELLVAHGSDAELIAALLVAWGPDEFFDHVLIVAGYGPAGAEVAELLVGTLSSTAVPASFGGALGAVVASRLQVPATLPADAFTHASAYVVTSFLAGSEHAPPGFAAALAAGVVGHAMAGGQFVGPHGAPSALPGGSGPLGVDFMNDPVAAVLVVVAGDPAAAAAFYADPALARYVFVEHDFDDGYTALFTSWAAACASARLRDPANPPTPEEAHAANLVATRGVAWLAERGGFDVTSVSDEASAAAATIVATHLLAVERTVVAPEPVDLSGTDVADPDGSAFTLPVIGHESLGPTVEVEVALFDADGLELLVAVAGTSDAGIEIVRAGATAFHEATASGLASELAADLAAGVPPAELSSRLDAVLARAGHVDGYLLATMWPVQQAAGRDRDQLVAFWVSNISTGAGWVIRQTPLSPFAAAVPVVGGELTGQFAVHEATAVADATAFAERQAGQLTFVFAAALAGVGLVEMPGASAAPGATEPSYDEFLALPAATRTEFWAALEQGTAGSGITLVLTTARDAIKIEQAEIYVS